MMKKVLLAIAALLALALGGVLIGAAMRPAEYRVERSLEIAASSDAVFARIGELPEWDKWSPWKAKDASMKTTYEGPRSGVGSSQSWTSDHSGGGSLKITEYVQNQRLRYKLSFQGWGSSSDGELRLDPVSGATTRLSWVMEGKNDFMGKVFWLVFGFEKAIAKDFDQGLLGIKKVVEEQRAAALAASEKAAADKAAAIAAATAAANAPTPAVDGPAPASVSDPVSTPPMAGQ